MNPNIEEVAQRIRSLRDDLGFSPEDMAEATGRSVEDYLAQESGTKDLTFTFLHKCAEKLGVDVVELMTGDSPRLKGYSLVRAGSGLRIKRNENFEYLHIAPYFDGKLCEPFIVTIPYSEEALQTEPHLSYHSGQELDYVLSGRMRFVYENHIEDVGPGDALLYDSGRGHGNIALDGEPCVILAVVIPEHESKIS